MNDPRTGTGTHISWLCGVSPLVLLLLLLTMAGHIRLGLGHWPTPMLGDYDTVAFRIHESMLIAVLLFTVYVAAPLWLLCLFFQRERLPWRVHLKQAVVFGLGWLLILFAGWCDPTTFTEWFLD